MPRVGKGFAASEMDEPYPFCFTDETWNGLVQALPEQLAPEKNSRLRQELQEWCSELGEMRYVNRKAGALAAFTRRRGKGQLSLIDGLAKNLRNAANIAVEMSKKEDDLLGNDDGVTQNGWAWLFSELQKLEPLATAVEGARNELKSRRLTELENPWHQFVRGVAQALRDIGLKPTASGVTYDKVKAPSWFQEYMLALNTALPDSAREPVHKDDAFYSRIAKALGKDGNKPGKSRK